MVSIRTRTTHANGLSFEKASHKTDGENQREIKRKKKKSVKTPTETHKKYLRRNKYLCKLCFSMKNVSKPMDTFDIFSDLLVCSLIVSCFWCSFSFS